MTYLPGIDADDLVPSRTAFGDIVHATFAPEAQIDSVYGLLSAEHAWAADGAGAAATVEVGPVFQAASGTAASGDAYVRSRALLRYRPGQAAASRFTAAWPDGAVADSEQLAGMFCAEGNFVGFARRSSDGAFGVLRRNGGRVDIHTLTLTVASGGAETATVTLNNVVFAGISLPGTSIRENAVTLAQQDYSSAGYTARQVGDTVVFVHGDPGERPGTFAYSSTGSSVGSFASPQAGAAPTDVFVAQASWNRDVCDGTGASGFVLDTTKLNVFAVQFGWLGATGPIWYIKDPTKSRFIEVHREEYEGTATVPHLVNPSLQVGWRSTNVGATTSQRIIGASAGVFLAGPTGAHLVAPRSHGRFYAAVTNSAPFDLVLAIRNPTTFAATRNMRRIKIAMITGACDGNQIVRLLAVRNPAFSTPPVWDSQNPSDSIVEYTLGQVSGAKVTVTEGQRLAEISVPKNGSELVDVARLGLDLQPGDVVALAAIADAGGNPNVSATIQWFEN